MQYSGFRFAYFGVRLSFFSQTPASVRWASDALSSCGAYRVAVKPVRAPGNRCCPKGEKSRRSTSMNPITCTHESRTNTGTNFRNYGTDPQPSKRIESDSHGSRSEDFEHELVRRQAFVYLQLTLRSRKPRILCESRTFSDAQFTSAPGAWPPSSATVRNDEA